MSYITGKALHDSYKERNMPELAKMRAKLAKMQAIKNPDTEVLKKINAYQRCIDSIKLNIWLIDEVYEKNACRKIAR